MRCQASLCFKQDLMLQEHCYSRHRSSHAWMTMPRTNPVSNAGLVPCNCIKESRPTPFDCLQSCSRQCRAAHASHNLITIVVIVVVVRGAAATIVIVVVVVRGAVAAIVVVVVVRGAVAAIVVVVVIVLRRRCHHCCCCCCCSRRRCRHCCCCCCCCCHHCLFLTTCVPGSGRSAHA